MRISTVGKTEAGFTLIELIVVVFLITLSLGLVAGINFKQQDSLQLKATSRQLYSFLLSVRSQAILQGQVNRCWYLADQHKIVADIQQRFIEVPEDFALQLSPEKQSTSRDGKTLVIHYYPDGSADGGDMCLRLGAQSLALNVDPLLGFLSLSASCDAAFDTSTL